MIASLIAGRGRVRRGERPSWLGAWGLVGLDFAALLAVFALIFEPLMTWLNASQPGQVATLAVMVAVFFVPLQAVLITSALWAARSRWEEKPGKGDDA